MKHQDMLGEMLDSAADRLAAYGYLLTGSQHAGEDLVQDAIVKVFVRQRRLENAKAAEAYVRAAMRTLHIDHMRRETHWRGLMPRLVDRRDPERPDDAVGEQDRIGKALAALGKQERTVVILRFYDDLKVADIAVQMHLADGTVKRYLSQALDKLAEFLGDIEGDLERIAIVERKK
jgi:RNA polymerase sigma factor (sigma-70 family)